MDKQNIDFIPHSKPPHQIFTKEFVFNWQLKLYKNITDTMNQIIKVLQISNFMFEDLKDLSLTKEDLIERAVLVFGDQNRENFEKLEQAELVEIITKQNGLLVEFFCYLFNNFKSDALLYLDISGSKDEFGLKLREMSKESIPIGTFIEILLDPRGESISKPILDGVVKGVAEKSPYQFLAQAFYMILEIFNRFAIQLKDPVIDSVFKTLANEYLKLSKLGLLSENSITMEALISQTKTQFQPQEK